MNQYRAELTRSLIGCADEAAAWIAQGEAILRKLYPTDARVEVRLRYGQHNWSPAVVFSVRMDSRGANVYPYVRVRLEGAKERSRRKYRDVSIDDIRLLYPNQ